MVISACGKLQWSVAERPLPGETLSGDGYLVAKTTTGWLMAVVDGLGHGPEAAGVTRTFIETLARHAESELLKLVRLGHKELRNTRGSACAIATIDSERCLLSWIGVGNVEGVVHHTAGGSPNPEYITMRGGIIGYRLPELQPSLVHLADGDILTMATDGINSDFVELIKPGQDPKLLSAGILNHYAKPNDDALVLVACWRNSLGQEGLTL